MAALLTGPGCIELHPAWQGTADAGSGTSMGSGSTSTASTGGSSSTGDETTGSTGMQTDGGASTGEQTDGGGSTGTGGLPGATIFITAATWTGDLGGLAGADAKCQTAADDAALGGSWVALLSDTTTNAVDRISFTGPLHNRAGETIAQDAADLFDGAIESPVLYDELGSPVHDNVWTGSGTDGVVWETCLDWTDASQMQGTRGLSDLADTDWITVGFWFCDLPIHLYCVGS